MTKFTKGPWETCNDGKCICGLIWSKPADRPVVSILSDKDVDCNLGCGPKVGSTEYQANAKLVKESPTMYDILKYFVNLRQSGEEISNDILGSINARWEDAEEIIKRVEGDNN